MSFDPSIASQTVYRTPYGTLLPPMGRVVAYVRATAFNDDDTAIANQRVPTIAAALTRVRAGMNDIIVVLPGHTENITAANAWSALRTNTQIIGLGSGASKPTLTFTGTASQLILAAAGVTLRGLQFNFGGGVDVVLGIDVTAAEVTIASCEFITSATTASRATTVMRLSAGANRFVFVDNYMRGNNGANSCVDGIVVNAAVTNAQFLRNTMVFGTTVVTVGNIRFATAAALDVYGYGNTIWNTTASSTCCVDYDVTVTGVWAYNNLLTSDGGTAPASSGFLGTLTGSRFVQNFCSTAGASGLLCPAADA